MRPSQAGPFALLALLRFTALRPPTVLPEGGKACQPRLVPSAKSQRFRQRLARHHFPISASGFAVESFPPLYGPVVTARKPSGSVGHDQNFWPPGSATFPR